MTERRSTTPRPAETPRRSWLRAALHGQIVSSDIFARHWLPILLTVAVVMTYITSKYICQTRMEDINELNQQLEIVKAERVRVRSLYMGRTCESSMQHLVDSLIPGLSVQERPPFKITDN